MAFTHLHLHTEYSLLDGACRIEPMLDKIKSMGQDSVAITDHGVMYGVLKFYKEAKKRGIKPIIGCEVYVAKNSRHDKVHGVDSERYHLTLLCKNNKGYRNLIKMVSMSWTEGFYTKPRVDKELLEKYHEGIIALSGCLSGEISVKILNGNYDEAKETALWYKNVFKDDFYLEIQNHGLEEELKTCYGIKNLSKELNIPLVATNDVHYIDKSDSRIQQVLICIQTNHILGEKTGLEFSADEFYLKSEEEMLSAFSDCPDAVSNTAVIADKCNVDFEFGKTKLPHFDVPDGTDHFEWFKSLCEKGLKDRYGDNPPQEYKNRMNYELDVINSMGYTDYYLIVHDFVSYAKSRGIPVGPGRGSGAASICAYCIGITGIDPMKYNLLFERFLNPERVSMPDFDIDFCYERRGEVIDYVIEKYGYDHVAQIVTFGTMAAKAAIRDVGRVLGVSYGKVDAVAKLVPRELNVTLSSALKESKELNELYNNDDTSREIIDTAMKIEGMPRHASTHAAGVVITADPVDSYVPLAVNDNSVVTQFTMKDLETLGLLKMDFLGLRTLTVIEHSEEEIRKKNPGFSINSVSTEDKKVYKMFAEARTEGVFQFESAGMKRVLSQLNPENLEDLIAVIALYRPGPMDSIPTYIANKNNPSGIDYPIPALKNILDVTYGCMVYQEQVMQICRAVAGYSFGRADIVRRAMAKKQHDVMLKERDSFVYGIKDENGNVICEGAVNRGVSEKDANGIFDRMISFASYAFNKAHAAAYAYVSYQTAYLKCYYPKEFFAALLTSYIDRTEKISEYILECGKLGIKIFAPDINSSGKKFSVNNEGIVFSLSAIKNIGGSFVGKIEQERESNGSFKSFFDFCSRMYGKDLNRKAVENLIRCGAFDKFGINRRQLLQSVDLILDLLNTRKNKYVDGQIGFGDLENESDNDFVSDYNYPNAMDFSLEEKLTMEKEIAGIYFSGHPMDKYSEYIKELNCDLITDIINDDIKYSDGSNIQIAGIITDVSKRTTKNGSIMAIINAEDSTDTIECLLFGKTYDKFRFIVSPGSPVVINGRVSSNDDLRPSIIADNLNLITDTEIKSVAPEKTEKSGAKGLFLRFDSQDSPQVEICRNLLSIFDGNERTAFYYSDSGKYFYSSGTQVNDVLLRELTKILGKENVIYNS